VLCLKIAVLSRRRRRRFSLVRYFHLIPSIIMYACQAHIRRPRTLVQVLKTSANCINEYTHVVSSPRSLHSHSRVRRQTREKRICIQKLVDATSIIVQLQRPTPHNTHLYCQPYSLSLFYRREKRLNGFRLYYHITVYKTHASTSLYCNHNFEPILAYLYNIYINIVKYKTKRSRFF